MLVAIPVQGRSAQQRQGDKSELPKAFENYGMPMSKSKSDEVFDVIDKNGDGCIDYKEFITAVLRSSNGPTSASLMWNSGRDKEKLQRSRFEQKKRPQKVWVYDSHTRGLISARDLE